MTVRWLATPTRTRLPRRLLANSSRSAWVTAAGSATSPSRIASAGSSAAATCSARIAPLTRTWAAAMSPGWMSSPTTSLPERRPILIFAFSEGDISLAVSGAGLVAVSGAGLQAPAKGLSARAGRRFRPARGSEEMIGVEAHELVAREHRDHAACCQKGPERNGGLAPRAASLARDYARADDGSQQQREHHGGGHVATEEESHDGGELDVTHAHAAGIRKRGCEQQAARDGAREQPFGLAGGIECQANAEPEQRTEGGDAVGDDAVLEVDQRRRHEQQDEHDAERDSGGRVAGQHRTYAQRGRHRLDERVALGDRGRAAAAAAAQQQVGDDRDVVVRLDRRTAGGAVRAGRHERLVSRQAVCDDVQERPHDGAQETGESDLHGLLIGAAGASLERLARIPLDDRGQRRGSRGRLPRTSAAGWTPA